MGPAPAACVAAVLLFVACGGEPVEVPPPPSASRSVGDPSPSATVSPTPTVELPAGLPATFDGNVEPADLPADVLIPDGMELTGRWLAITSAGEVVVVSWADPGGVDFQLKGGVAAWRREGGDPPWRAVFGRSIAAEEGVLGLEVEIADVTGDASDDAVITESTGGTGACGRYLVLDLATARLVWTRELCDAQVGPSTAPPGLAIRRAVFEAGDAHCCPSAFRTTVLTYLGDGRWEKASEEIGPT